jgi:hypothetical protein
MTIRPLKIGRTILVGCGIVSAVGLAVNTVCDLTVALNALANARSVTSARSVAPRVDVHKTGFAEGVRTIGDGCTGDAGEIRPVVVIVLSSYSLGSMRSLAAWRHALPAVAAGERCVWLISYDDFSALPGLQEAIERAGGRVRRMVVSDVVAFAVRTGVREAPATLLIDAAGFGRALTIGELTLARANELIVMAQRRRTGEPLDLVRAPNADFMYFK